MPARGTEARVAPIHGPKARIGIGDPLAVAQRQGDQRIAESETCPSHERVPWTWPPLSRAHCTFITGRRACHGNRHPAREPDDTLGKE